MKELNNPFVVYRYKGPKYFCDRVAETEKIVMKKYLKPTLTWLYRN